MAQALCDAAPWAFGVVGTILLAQVTSPLRWKICCRKDLQKGLILLNYPKVKMRRNPNKENNDGFSHLMDFGGNGMAALVMACLIPSAGFAQEPATSTPAPVSGTAPVATTAPVQTEDQLPPTVVTGRTADPAPAAPAPRPSAPRVVPTPPPAPLAPVEPPLVVDTLLMNEVTAFRTGTPLIDIPQSVSIFSEERIQDQAFTSLGEIVDYTPGLTSSQGEGHRDAIVFRGVRSTADFYIDGVRDDVEYFRPLYNIERVEILRGPSALYFGRGGTGGILNRVSKKPIIGEPTSEGGSYTDPNFRNYEVSVDSFGANISQLDVNQSLNDNSAFRLNTFYEYLNNHRDFFDGNRIGVNPTYAVELGPDTRLDFSYEFSDHEQFIDRGIPSANGFPVRALAGRVFGDSELNVADFRANTFRTMINHSFSDQWKGRVSVFYGDYDKSYSNYFPTAYNATTNNVTMAGYVDNTARQNLIFSGDIIGEFETSGMEHKVFLGTEFINTSSDQDRFNAVWNGANTFNATNFSLRNGTGINSLGNTVTGRYTALNDDTRVTIDTASVFFQDEISMGEYFDLVVGGRFDSFDIEVFDAKNGGTLSRKDQQFSPRYGLVAKPYEDISVYGSYSESFLPRSGDQFADLGGGRNALEPNTYSNLEAGINWDLNENLSLRTAAFKIEESSPQVSGPGTLVVVDSEITGFEAQLTGYLTEDWFLSTGYSNLNGEQVNVNGPTGLKPRELPRNSFSIWNKYQATERLGLGLGVVYQDDSFATLNNRVTLPSFTRVDAAVFYQLSEKTRLQLNIENLFDTDYFPNSHDAHNITVGRPINAAFSIRSSF